MSKQEEKPVRVCLDIEAECPWELATLEQHPRQWPPQLQPTIEAVHEALLQVEDLYLDQTLNEATWKRNAQRRDDIQRALEVALDYLELQQPKKEGEQS